MQRNHLQQVSVLQDTCARVRETLLILSLSVGMNVYLDAWKGLEK